MVSPNPSPTADARAIEASQQFAEVAERSSVLYKLTAEYAYLLDLIEQAEDEDDVVPWEMALDELAGDIRQKSESLAGLIRWCDGLADIRKAEAKRMAASAAVFERRATRLKDYLKRNLEAAGIERVDTSRFSLVIRVNNPHVEVLEEALVPGEFQRVIPAKIEVDKRSILAHVKATGEIPAGVTVERGTRLDIS